MNYRPESWKDVKMAEGVEEPVPSDTKTEKKDVGEEDEEENSEEDSEDSDFDLGGNPNRRRFYVESDSDEDSE